MIHPLSDFEIHEERDVARARQHARTIAARLGYDVRDQSRLASVVSGFAGGLARHEGGGRLEFRLEGDPPKALGIRVVAGSPGHQGEDHLLDAARRMMDAFLADESTTPGTSFIMTKALPGHVNLTTDDASKLVEELLGLDPTTTLEEALRQDGELLHLLEHLEAREEELARLSHDLEDTNRGVLALNVELDEQADSLRWAGETNTRFLANVSHELRTPLSSILGLARLLIDRSDGDLSPEQELQASFIVRSAQDLARMINDLLDLARIEAGREVVRPTEVDLPRLLGALRGMVRPLVPADSSVNLLIDEPDGLPPIFTDEPKLTQILRNLLSNALKFTERGEVRLKVEAGPNETVVFSVSDTGIGIENEQLSRIFDEFGSGNSSLKPPTKGTGLVLPLVRKLARLLGGDVEVRSEPGVGSTFSVTIPARFSHPQ